MAISTIGGSSSSGGLQQYEQLFTTSGTWTKPAGVKTAEVTILGGTGGNGSGYPTSAGGYWKGIVDVSAMSTVPVTVGASAGGGGTGGTSSFGSLVGAPGNIAGAYYTSRPGYGYAAATAVGTAGYNDRWAGIPNGSGKAKISQDGTFCYIQGAVSGYTICSTNGGQSWAASGATFNIGTKILAKNGTYVNVPITSPGAGGLYDSIKYSTDGVNWTAATAPGSGYWYGFALGPAGFLAIGGNGTYKSTDGITWTSVTTGLPSTYMRLQATSTRYYAFQNDVSTTSVYTSTDGTTWTSFNMAWTISSYQEEKNWTSYNGKVYYSNASNSLGVIDGTSSYTTTAVSLNGFYQINSIFWTNNIADGGNVYSVESPSTPLFTWQFGSSGSYIPLITNNAVYFRASSGGTTIDRMVLSDGSNGFGTWTPGSTSQASPGVLGSGLNSSNTTYFTPIPGRGQEDGWGQGAGGTGSISARTYGSGTTAVQGNQGVVRIRWWA
jgi:hypothetical protein